MGKDTIITIIAAAVIISVLGIILISLFSYTPPALPSGNKKASAFSWNDVYKIEAVSKARYNIISMANGEMNKSEVLLTFSKNPDGTALIDIVVYDGIVQSTTSAGIKIDTVTFSCVSKYYGAEVIQCNKPYPDAEVQLATYVLPQLMRKYDILDIVVVESAIYKGNVYEAVRLRKENIDMWIVKDVPIPVRIVLSDNENKKYVIANLQSYE
ncbi:MAG: hypothetical protein QXS93_04680 [Candidatus Micrarchaeia archaeon]